MMTKNQSNVTEFKLIESRPARFKTDRQGSIPIILNKEVEGESIQLSLCISDKDVALVDERTHQILHTLKFDGNINMAVNKDHHIVFTYDSNKKEAALLVPNNYKIWAADIKQIVTCLDYCFG
jgi:hypothetical protein